MNTILLPVDGSDHATKAAELAGVLAHAHDASVVVLHVHTQAALTPEQCRMAEVEHMIPAGQKQFPWVANAPADLAAVLHQAQVVERNQDVLDFIANRVVGIARDILIERGVDARRIRFLVKNGNPAERIIETVAEVGADAIVMGSRGLSAFRGLAFGSASHAVSHAAPCQVITVT